MSNTPIKYMVQLDGLRAFAVALVMVAHWTLDLPVLPQLPLGQMGIELFFVLSGFLISSILLKTRGKDSNGKVLKNFYLRRALRIFPVYYATLFVLFNGGDLWITNLEVDRLAIWHLTYTNNFFYFFNGNFLGAESHFWTLSVEEQFYLIWPFIMLFTPIKWLKKVIITLLVGSILFRAWLVFDGHLFVRTLMPSQIFAFAMGALLALMHQEDSKAQPKFLQFNQPFVWMALIAFLLIQVAYSLNHLKGAYQIIGEPLMAFIFWAIIAKAKTGFGGWFGQSLQWKPIVYVGKISYGIYIFHNFAPSLVMSTCNAMEWSPQPILIRGVFLVVTIAIAAISWELMEKPLLSLKRFFEYKGTETMKTASNE
jgi:peptidoglycan/LPS O-acetylase OafA/YrhL